MRACWRWLVGLPPLRNPGQRLAEHYEWINSKTDLADGADVEVASTFASSLKAQPAAYRFGAVLLPPLMLVLGGGFGGILGALLSASPPLHTGPHRYILVLFKQLKPGQLSGYTQRRREKWPLKQFMEDNLNALMPVAATFFRAQTAEDEPKSPGYKSEL